MTLEALGCLGSVLYALFVKPITMAARLLWWVVFDHRPLSESFRFHVKVEVEPFKKDNHHEDPIP